MTNKRIIVIGDIHGCHDELISLLDKVKYTESDRLVCVGDLVDRGPKALNVIQTLRKLGAECTLGNHDERLIRYRRHMKKNIEDPSYQIPMKASTNLPIEEMTEEDWAYLESLPNYIRLTRNWVALHAGLEPGKPVEEQHPDVLLHCRYLRMSTGLMERNIANLIPGDACFWAELWNGRDNIVYGHMVTPMKMPHIDIGPGWGAICVGIDTGCCFGHNLTAMILNEEGYSFSFVSVPAKDHYDPDLINYLAATTI